MNVQIPNHIATLKSYQLGKTIRQLQKEYGWDKMAILWNNENTLGFSPKSKEVVIKAYDKINYYPDPISVDLRVRLSEKLQKKENEIILGNGSEAVLMLVIRTLCSGDDELLTSKGGFMIIYNWARINNIRSVSMPMTEAYGFDLEAIKNRINRNTKIIYLANVNNPTGTMISKPELKEFMQHVPEHILVIVDEAYFEFSTDLAEGFPNSLEMDYPNILTLRTFSKAYGIAGIRLGFAVAHQKIIESMFKAKLTFEPTALAQAAGLGALEDEDFLRKSLSNNSKGLNYYYREFNRLGINYIPSYGNFVMTIWKDINEVENVFSELMKKGVLVRPLVGSLRHCIRISVGRPEENELLIEALETI